MVDKLLIIILQGFDLLFKHVIISLDREMVNLIINIFLICQWRLCFMQNIICR